MTWRGVSRRYGGRVVRAPAVPRRRKRGEGERGWGERGGGAKGAPPAGRGAAGPLEAPREPALPAGEPRGCRCPAVGGARGPARRSRVAGPAGCRREVGGRDFGRPRARARRAPGPRQLRRHHRRALARRRGCSNLPTLLSDSWQPPAVPRGSFPALDLVVGSRPGPGSPLEGGGARVRGRGGAGAGARTLVSCAIFLLMRRCRSSPVAIAGAAPPAGPSIWVVAGQGGLSLPALFLFGLGDGALPSWFGVQTLDPRD